MSKLGRGNGASNAGDNSDFFLLGNFDQAGGSAQDIDPEILREESEQSARQAAAVVTGDEENNGQSKSSSSKRNEASGMIHDDGQLVDVGDDVGLLSQKADFNALAVAAKLMESTGEGDHHDLMSRKNGGNSNRFAGSPSNSAQVAAAVAEAVKLHEQQQQRQRQLQQQQKQYPYNSAFQQNEGAGQASGHNLFADRSSNENAGDIAENYTQYLRAQQDPKLHQQQLRNLRQQQQQQHHMLSNRNSLNSVISQQQMAAVAAAATSNVRPGSANQLLSSQMMNAPHHSINGKRRLRLRWSEEETKALIDGCQVHGVGNWKKILTDPNYRFNNRTAVDLKDRFRTSFPDEYSRLYPNARTHKSKRKAAPMEPSTLKKINRKERQSFTPQEDQRLLEGFERHGAAWSKIQRDETLGLGERRSTDLRDRFRNAFPERYIAAGYKGRGTPKRTLQTLPNDADDASYINHNLDSTGSGAAGAGGDYPMIPSMGNGGYGGQGGVADRASARNVQMSPSFKAAAAAFANSNMDELADAKHQEDVMSSIKLEGLNGDDEDEDDGVGLIDSERQDILERQLALEQLQHQQDGHKGQTSQDSSSRMKQEAGGHTSRSASPTIIAAAAAAAIAASVSDGVDVAATSGTQLRGKSVKSEQHASGDAGNDALLYNPLYYGNNAGHAR